MIGPLHSMIPIPKGKTVGDILPVYANVVGEVVVGKKIPVCASCRKPFTEARKRRKAIRMYPVMAMVPVAFSYDICGACFGLYRKGGASRDSVLASVEAYSEDERADQ